MAKTKPIKPKEKRTIVSNKKKDRDQFIKEMDMLRLKQKIIEIMKKVSDDKSKIENSNKKYKKTIEIINEKYTDNSSVLYQSNFQNYIKNQFNFLCITFVNKIILDVKRNHLESFEGKYNFNKIFISLTKELLLNEFELILLSLYLEYIDISLFVNTFKLEETLLYLFYFVKKISTNDNQLGVINSYLSKKYQNFSNNFEKWFKLNEKQLNNKLFNYIEINQRFTEYNIPFNIYCGNNYIDYNYIVDRILTMSLPYVDVKKESNNNTTNNNNNSLLSSNYDKNNNSNNFSSFISNSVNNNPTGENYSNKDNKNRNFNVINLEIDENKEYNRQQLIKPETSFTELNDQQINDNLNSVTNSKKEPLNNLSYNSLNKKIKVIDNKTNNNNNKFIINSTPGVVTPNHLLHNLNMNRYMINPDNNNNKILLNQNLIGNISTNKSNIDYYGNNFINLNKPSINQEDLIQKKLQNPMLINPLPTPSQSSFIFPQKPSLMEINLFNRNNSSHFFDDEGELKQILAGSSENYMRSSISFDNNPKYPYGIYMNPGNNNINIINPNTNNNLLNPNQNNNLNSKGNNNILSGVKGCDNFNKNNNKYNNNEALFRPLNMICNKNSGNILSQNKLLYNNQELDYLKSSNNIISFHKETESINKTDN